MATRDLTITGTMVTELADAIISINGTQSYSGPIGVGVTPVPPGTVGPADNLIIAGFTQEDINVTEAITVTVTVVSGAISVGRMSVNIQEGRFYPDIDFRSNITINGLAPTWPTDGGPTVPKGTPENPDWTGWCFQLDVGDVFECLFEAIPYGVYTAPPA